MEKISRYVSMEDDPWFIKGEQKGELKGKLEGELKQEGKFITNLIQGTDFDDAKIASLVNVDLAFVQQVRARLEQEGK